MMLIIMIQSCNAVPAHAHMADAAAYMISVWSSIWITMRVIGISMLVQMATSRLEMGCLALSATWAAARGEHACRHLAPRLDTLARAMAESFGEAQAEILRIAALFLPTRTPLTCPLALSACFVGSGLFLQVLNSSKS